MDTSNYFPIFVASTTFAIFLLAATRFRPWLRYTLSIAVMILPCLLVYAWIHVFTAFLAPVACVARLEA